MFSKSTLLMELKGKQVDIKQMSSGAITILTKSTDPYHCEEIIDVGMDMFKTNKPPYGVIYYSIEHVTSIVDNGAVLDQ
jgi:hypothetical protein